MRQHHKAGEKMFVDFSGKKPAVADPATGEVRAVELFVAVLGASGLTYAEAVPSQAVPHWISAHVHAMEYFGGVAQVIIPDQLRSGVSVPHRSEPEIQRTYLEMARHFGAVVIPARPRKPRDKAKVEVAVQVVQRWVLARLRNETFFSLAELNARIRTLLDALNERPSKKLGGTTRRGLFEQVEKAALRPLPARAFEYAEWKTVKVNLDYHVEVEHHWYSAPHALVGEHLEVSLPRFRGHQQTAYRRQGVHDGETQATFVHPGVQGRGGPALHGRRPDHPAGCEGP